MTLKKLLKKKEYNKYTTIEIIDISNPYRFSITTKLHNSFYVKPLDPYFKRILRRKVKQVYVYNEKRIKVEIY